MCFAYSVNFNKTALVSQLKLEELPDFSPEPAVKAFNNPLLPIVIKKDTFKIEFMHWGLIPQWVNNKEQAAEIVKNTYNARSETIDTKPSFKESYLNSRCIIPAAGFFEWQHIQNKRYPHYIYPAQQDLFYFAGLFSIYNNTGTFSIITTQANKLMKEIHNAKQRQPAILLKEQINFWLDGEMSNNQIPILPDTAMKAHKVSPEISSASKLYTLQVNEPYSYPELGQLNLF